MANITTFTDSQLGQLRAEYGQLATFHVKYLGQMRRLLGGCSNEAIAQLEAAGIKFVSKLARNERLRRAPRGPVHTCDMVSNVRHFCAACGR